MSFTVIIPARMKSTRLPEKPLLPIEGVPMVMRVAEAARKSGALRVVVATDHEAICDACRAYGVEALMTKASHPTGTDRLSEAVEMMGLPDDAIIVNVQGDEPLIPPEVVGQVAELLEAHPECAIATAAHPIRDVESFMNPNVVKVELNAKGEAMTFTRAPVPWPRDHFRKHGMSSMPEGHPSLHHVGLYAYRAGFLKRFPTLPQAPIEEAESLEQLRAMYFGERIAVLVLDAALPAGVDTQEDLDRVRAVIREEKAKQKALEAR